MEEWHVNIHRVEETDIARRIATRKWWHQQHSHRIDKDRSRTVSHQAWMTTTGKCCGVPQHYHNSKTPYYLHVCYFVFPVGFPLFLSVYLWSCTSSLGLRHSLSTGLGVCGQSRIRQLWHIDWLWFISMSIYYCSELFSSHVILKWTSVCDSRNWWYTDTVWYVSLLLSSKPGVRLFSIYPCLFYDCVADVIISLSLSVSLGLCMSTCHSSIHSSSFFFHSFSISSYSLQRCSLSYWFVFLSGA